ncbi:MAG: SCO family protein [Anaerolineales bacterium]|nr:SCO family protein [Anaerolineales bacterium]
MSTHSHTSTSNRFWLVVFALPLLFLLAGCGATATPEPHEFAGAVVTNPQPAPDFTLVSADGPVNLSDYEGKYIYLYFGYTFCPDVCPATMNELAKMTEQLGADAENVQVIMITVDPARDTAELLRDYMAFFDPSFIGLTGTEEEIAAVANTYGVFYEAHEGSAESGYLVDHSTRTYLFSPERVPIVAYPFDVSAEAMAEDLRYLLTN